MNPELFSKSIFNVCNFCQKYDKNLPMSAGSASANAVRRDLRYLADGLFGSLNEAFDFSKELQATFSKGSGTFPKVPWIAFLPKGKSVSNSISTTICFARSGQGIVLGVMAPAGYSQKNFTTVKRTESPPYLNIDGSAKTRYNNLFLNPKEFIISEISKDLVSEYLLSSIQVMNKIK